MNAAFPMSFTKSDGTINAFCPGAGEMNAASADPWTGSRAVAPPT